MLFTPKEKPNKLCFLWKNDCKKHTKFLNDLSFPSKPLLILYTEEINKFWNCFLSSSGYSDGEKMQINMVDFKAINDADTDSQIAIFLQILAHCVMGFFFRLYHVRCAFFSTRPHTILVLYQRQKKYENNVRTMSYT